MASLDMTEIAEIVGALVDAYTKSDLAAKFGLLAGQFRRAFEAEGFTQEQAARLTIGMMEKLGGNHS